jgi:hypothetical protein
LKIVIDRSPYTKETLAPLVGKTSAELQQMIDGTLPIEDVVNQKLQLRLYEWLTPGPGINTCVAFDAAAKTFCEESAKRDWEAGDVPFIILGHELIHAWRMLTGRRIFLGGVGEEHMTTGLPPYSAMKFTENKLRAEANLAIRDYYSANPLLQELEMVTSVSSPYLRRQQGLAKFWTAATGKR